MSLTMGNSVLDIGCGCGHLYALIRWIAWTEALNRIKYLGVDDSPEMLAFCHDAFPEGKFELGDVYDLSGLPMFDTVCCLSVLLHLPDPWDKPLSELWGRAGKALVFNTLIDDANPRVEHMEDDLIYNVATESQVLEAAGRLPKVAKVESWVTKADGSEGRELMFVRCLR
jgi:SAM-dependent methyltransferase